MAKRLIDMTPAERVAWLREDRKKKKIGEETLGSDLQAFWKDAKKAEEWQDADTMAGASASAAALLDRAKAYRDYYAGKDGFDSEGADKVIRGLEDVSGWLSDQSALFGDFDNADDYNAWYRKVSDNEAKYGGKSSAELAQMMEAYENRRDARNEYIDGKIAEVRDEYAKLQLLTGTPVIDLGEEDIAYLAQYGLNPRELGYTKNAATALDSLFADTEAKIAELEQGKLGKADPVVQHYYYQALLEELGASGYVSAVKGTPASGADRDETFDFAVRTGEDEIKRIEALQTLRGGDLTTDYGATGYEELTDDEKSLYLCLADNVGEGAARAYYDYLYSTNSDYNVALAARVGKSRSEAKSKFEKIFNSGGMGVNSWLAGNKRAVESLFSDGEGEIYPFEYEMQYDRDSLSNSKVATGLYDLGVSFGNMAPSVLAGVLTGNMSGGAQLAANVATFGVSIYGNAYDEAKKLGYSKSQAINYGILNAASEVALQNLIGGIPGVGSHLTGEVVSQLANKTSNVLLRVAAQISGDAMGEFTEEYLQEVLGQVFRNVALGEDGEVKLFSEEALYSGIIGALMSMGMNVPTSAVNMANLNSVGKLYNTGESELADGARITGAESLIKEGLAAKPSSEAYQYAERLSKRMAEGKKLSNMQLGTLAQLITKAAKAEQSKASVGYSELSTKPTSEMHFVFDNSSAPKDIRVSRGLVNFANQVLSMKDKSLLNKRKYKLGKVSKIHADTIKKATGLDITGYEIWIDGSAIQHIENRHGVNGEADHSMADRSDIGKILYVVNNADGGEVLLSEDGTFDVDEVYKNADNTPAKKVLLYKQMEDGVFLVAECVPESSTKRLQIKSAYKKSGNGQVLNMQASKSSPQTTSETPLGYPTATNSIPYSSESVKENLEKNYSEYQEGLDALWRAALGADLGAGGAEELSVGEREVMEQNAAESENEGVQSDSYQADAAVVAEAAAGLSGESEMVAQYETFNADVGDRERQNADVYVADYKMVRDLAAGGMTEGGIRSVIKSGNGAGSSLNEAQFLAAYSEGHAIAVANKKARAVDKSVPRRVGKVYYNGAQAVRTAGGVLSLPASGISKGSRLNADQRSVVEFAEKVLAPMGVDVVFYSSKKDRSLPNGLYDGKYIYIDIEAGMSERASETFVAFAMAHELTHMAERLSPELWQRYADAVLDVLAREEGISIRRLIERRKLEYADARVGTLRKTYPEKSDAQLRHMVEPLSDDGAIREIVADASQLIFTRESRFAEKLAKKDAGLGNKLLQMILEVIEKLQAVIRGVPRDGVSEHLLGHLEELREYFDDMMADALDNAGHGTAAENDFFDSALDNGQKKENSQVAGNVQFQERRITEGMDEQERAAILQKKKIVAPVYEGQADAFIEQETDLESARKGLVEAALVRIGTEFDIFTDYNVKDIEVKITLSRGNLRESISKDATPLQVAKLLPVLKDVVENAIGIECHRNRYYYDTYTVSFDNLFGGYVDGKYFIPVRFGLKHNITGGTTLYVVVDQTKIETEVLGATPSQKMKPFDPRPVSKYSVAQIVPFVNSKDLLRYLPDDMLSAEQKNAKWEAIAETIQYTNEKNDNKYTKLIREGKMDAAKQMVKAAANANGYSIAAYHGTNNQEEHRTWNAERRVWETDYSPITVFKRQYEEQVGHFFSADKDNAGGYGSTVYSVFLMIKKPLEIECNGQGYDSISFDGKVMDTYEWAEYARKHHYDGVIFKDVRDGVDWGDLGDPITEYVVFDSNRIKSADPITYDNEGNIIPISKRFNVIQRDIRFQYRRIDPETDRQVLARALAGAAKSEADQGIVKDYVARMDQYREKQKQLNELLDSIDKMQEEVNAGRAHRSELNPLYNRAEILENQLRREDAKLLRMEAMTPLHNLVEAERARTRAEERRTDLAYRQGQRALEKLEDRHAENKRKANERKLRVQYLARAERAISRIYKWTAHPTKKAHVPTKLLPYVKSLFDTVEVSHHFAQIERLEEQLAAQNERIRELQELGASASVIHAQEVLRIDIQNRIKKLEGTQHNMTWAERMDALKNIMSSVENNQNASQIYVDFAPGLAEDIERQVDRFTDRPGVTRLFDAKPEDIRFYAEALESIAHSITEAGRLYGNKRAAKVETLAEESIREFRQEKREVGKAQRLEIPRKWYGLDALNPAYFAHKLGQGTEAVMDELYDGFNRVISNVRVIDTFSEKLRKKYRVADFTGKNQKIHQIRLERGGSISLTTGQLMTVFALSDRPQAQKHMFGRGIQSFSGNLREAIEKTRPLGERVADEVKRLVGRGERDLSEYAKMLFGSIDVHRVTQGDIDSMIELLTPEQRQCVKEIKRFLREDIAAMGNKTSQELYLYDMFTEENYFPIETVATFRAFSEKDKDVGSGGTVDARSVFSVLNKGFTKTLQEEAGNPLVVRDIFDVFMEHCFDMANYAGLGVAVSDTIRWLSYRQKVVVDQKENSQTGGNVQMQVRNTEFSPKRYTEAELVENARSVLHSKAVAQLTGEEFQRIEGEKLSDRVIAFFDSIGNVAHHKELGEIALTKSSFRDDKAHGLTRNKIISFKAVPQVIENGYVIDQYQPAGKPYERITIAAPILIGNQKYYVGVMVQKDNQSQRMYLHDIITEEATLSFNTEPTAQASEGIRDKGHLFVTSILQNALSVKSDSKNSENFQGNTVQMQNRLEEVMLSRGSEDGTTLRDEMEKAWGKGAERYIRNLLMSIEGELKGTDGAKAINKLVRNAKIASVAGNMRMVLQQPTAYWRAASILSPKSLIGAVRFSGKNKELIEEAIEHSELMYYKSLGFYDMNNSRSLLEKLKGDASMADRLREWTTAPAGWMDMQTWGTLWRACRIEIDAEIKSQGLSVTKNSNEYFAMVREKFHEVINFTQVIDSPMHKNKLMSDPDSLMKQLTAFMAEPMLTLNMVQTAADDVRRKRPGSREKLARVSVVFFVNVAMTSLASAFADAARDDDEDEGWLEKYGEAALRNFTGVDLDSISAGEILAGDWNLLNNMPIVKEMFSILEGYEPSRMEISGIEKMIAAMTKTVRLISEGGDVEKTLYSVAQAISTVTGIPVSNLWRLVRSFINNMNTLFR